MTFPFISDPKLNQKSVTVTFVVISFVLSILSLCLSHKFPSCLPATILSICFFTLNMVFYRMRHLDDMSLNLKTGSIELKNEKDSNTKI